MNRSQKILLISGAFIGVLLLISLSYIASGQTSEDSVMYMPLISVPEPTPTPTPTPTPKPSPTPKPGQMKEFRGLWVTRWDWAVNATQGTIDAIVNDAATAGFNAILFQVRGAADAYYPSSIEPWGRLLRGGLGVSPGFDPLARMISKAHERGIEVHAYINVYTVWDKCTLESKPPYVNPVPFYYLLKNTHGQPDPSNINNGLQWDTGDNIICGDGYLWASPASVFADNHYLSVANDLASRYDLDGLHLDRIRYSSRFSSCDPVSEGAAGVSCFQTPSGYASYGAWQRAQVNGTVFKFYDLIKDKYPDMMLSAAVWHTYIDYWGWGYTEGYYDYYQDSQGWIKGDYIDAIMPMIYSSNPATFSQPRWRTLVENFQANSGGRFIIAGIGSNHYDSFSEITARINIARDIGTAGHALFSYGGLKQKGYFDDLAAGPYAQPASVPDIPWH